MTILIVLATAILSLLVMNFYKKNSIEMKSLRDILLNTEELEVHAAEVARGHTVHKKRRSTGVLLKRLDYNYKFIASVYKELRGMAKENLSVPLASEWLLDNFYLIEEQVKEIRQNLVKKRFLKLQVLDTGVLRGYPRIYALALELISHTDGRLDEKDLEKFINSYQTRRILSIAEVWALSLMIRMALIEYIKNICEKIRETQTEWTRIERLDYGDYDKLLKLVKNDMEEMEGVNPYYVERLLRRIRKEGIKQGEILEYIDKKLDEYNTYRDKVIQQVHQEQAAKKISIGNAITSLKLVSTIDWNEIFESLSVVEEILRNDPSGIYTEMDFESRDYYRGQIENIAKMCETSEIKVAKKAIEHARTALDKGKDEKLRHVGYYIIGKGRKSLMSDLGCKKTIINLGEYPLYIYIFPISILTLIMTAFFAYYAYMYSDSMTIGILAGFSVLIPASDISIAIVNWIVTHVVPPAYLPKLEYRKGIPKEASTLVVIPTLLPNEERVTELLDQLEVYYNANRDKNIYFALAGDFKDSESKEDPSDKKIIERALKEIRKLNNKYRKDKDIFYFFHRHRQYSEGQERWMGWERKRGALVELNQLLQGRKDTSYSIIEGDLSNLQNKIKYVITLDGDTKLPIGAARKLIGTISHPLNRAVFDNKKGIIISGYGIIQPKIGIDIESANSSKFTRIFAGQGGIDPYTTAYSDVYQDLFGEGIFTGKGIYDVDAFNKTLTNAIPENTVLSHDLLEGSYLRTGLATDIELIDGYPSRYSSYIMRLHRWVRGDWQLIRWLFSSSLSRLSKWKILDNLRRSLVSVSLMLLLTLGLTVLPGNAFIWIGFTLISIGFPLMLAFVDYLINRYYRAVREKLNGNLICGFKAVSYQILLSFLFLPYHAYMMVDAIIRTLYRVFISKKNLLEWTTAADVEKKLKNDSKSFIMRMRSAIYIAILLCILVIATRPYNLIYILPLSIGWALSPFVAYKISKEEVKEKERLDEKGNKVLRTMARKTWAYFEDFAGQENNYLPPDNLQEDPPNGLAYRTSPTNIGMLLISILGARDFGYISTIGMIDRLEKTISTIERLETWNGHLYNWYDIKSLEPIRPFFISTVDSGNLVGYLFTIRQGIKEYITKPLIDGNLIKGIKDTIELNQLQDEKDTKYIDEILDKREIRVREWKEFINVVKSDQYEDTYWGYKLYEMIESFMDETDKIFPATDYIKTNKGKSYYNKIIDQLQAIEKNNSLIDLIEIYKKILIYIDEALKEVKNSKEDKKNLINLKKDVNRAKEYVLSNLDKAEDLLKRITRLIDETEFAPLYDSRRHLFAIGYNIEDNKLVNSYYDLLASEARITSYIAIARGEVPIKHWSKLGRALSIVDGYRGLVSWTGTIFEYLMPALIMKNYKNTLLDETYGTVIKAQKSYGEKRGVPWGVSESGYYAFDVNFNYQYKAFGVSDLGLKRGLIEDIVVSPYSTLLTVPFEPRDAVKNMEELISEGLEGDYGFYEAVDYTPKRTPYGEKKGIVKSFMAHHLGMSFIAINNYLYDNLMQDRFHADPVIKAGEVLLQEKVPLRVIITKEYKEKVKPLEEIPVENRKVTRSFGAIEYPLPKCHILSNNRYSVMITNEGSGYSKSGDLQVTRWRKDVTTGKYGTFIFLREVQSGNMWSATYEPINKEPDGYKVLFSQDKAEFIRTDENIDTHTEIVVSSEDNVEIRKVTLTNHNNYPVTVELTSYFETVITRHASDVAHPAFSNLFIRTEMLSEYDSILASRRPRETDEETGWAVHTVVTEGEIVGNLQCETNRENFIGRGNNLSNPSALSKPLTNTTGIVIDPIMSLRRTVKIEPSDKVEVSFITGVGKSREEVVEIAKKYHNSASISRAFDLAYSRSQVEVSYLNLSSKEIETYQDLISHIIFASPVRKKNQDILKQNKKGQSALWAYGISGDNPIVLVTIDKEDDIDIVNQALKAHEYWKMKGLKVDLVILNEDKSNYIQPLQDYINELLFASHSRDMKDKPGGVFIRKADIMPKEDIVLLYTAAKVVLKGDEGSISSQIVIEYDRDELPKKKRFNSSDIVYSNEEIKFHELRYFNGYGGFSEDGKEYIITLKGTKHTPAPWINVISNEKFGFQVSESGSGFTWAENSRENKLTPWTNDPVSDTPGEIIYLRDEESGCVWTVTPLPIREKEEYVVRHGFGYSKFEHNSHGINQELTMFVPVDDPVKINLLKLKNNFQSRKRFTITYYIKPVLGVTREKTMEYIDSEILRDTNSFTIKNSYNTEFPGRIAFIDSSESIKSYTGDNNEFIGRAGNLDNPEALRRERLSNRVGSGFDPCGAIQIEVELNAYEEREIVFLLGEVNDLEKVKKVVNEYRDIGRVKKALKEVKENWNNILQTVTVNTPDLSMDLMINYWLLYQTISCRLWARSAFYQSGGAFGFRDQLQDAMNSLYVYPEKTRDQILLHSAHQFVEGDVQHWWHQTPSAEADKGIRTKFSDDLLWLPLATAEYVEKTNDFSVLEEEIGYIESDPLGEDEDEKYDIPRISSETSSVYEHCIRAIERSLKYGPHDIPLMGSGDWNDGMNKVGNKGRGESIWLGWFICLILKKFASICKKMGDHERAKRYIETADKISNAIEKNAWDGQWYRRAYFDDGTPLGSSKNSECIIDSLAQSWSVISGYGKPSRSKEAMEAVERYLIKEDKGLILLFTPPFDKSDQEPGYIKGYVPGVRENGGQYTHGATWVINAFALMGNGDKAWKLYNLINPINHARTPIECSTYKVEPYVMAADVYAVSPHEGRGGWTWYTGAAGWMYRVGIEYILGLKKSGEKLIIDPCIPKDWPQYNMQYKYNKTFYHITVENPNCVNRGVKQIKVDGKVIEGNGFTLIDDGNVHKVYVTLG